MAKQQSAEIDFDQIDILKELDEHGVEYKQSNEDNVRMMCPFHEDAEPSMDLHHKRGVFKCHAGSCGIKGNFIKLLSKIRGENGFLTRNYLVKKYSIQAASVMDPSRLAGYTVDLLNHPEFLEALRTRGITVDDIHDAKLGVNQGRIQIPIFDVQHQLINLRKYLPGAPTKDKMRNAQGRGFNKIYMPDQLAYDILWLFGGEMKALAAKKYLNKLSIGAISTTGGEGEDGWSNEFNEHIQGKHVYICYDIDDSGRIGASKVAKRIFASAGSVRIVKLPLSEKEFPKGDVNDYIYAKNPSVKDFEDMMVGLEKFIPVQADDSTNLENVQVHDISLHSGKDASYVNKRVRVEATISTRVEPPYFIPKDIRLNCDRSQANCDTCPVTAQKPDDQGYVNLTINKTNAGIVEMINCASSKMRGVIGESLGIPRCRVWSYIESTNHTVHEVTISPKLTIEDQDIDNTTLNGFCITTDMDMNSPYMMTGFVRPHSRNRQAIVVFDDLEQSEDSLSSFSPSDNQMEALHKFQPKEWTVTGLKEKLDEIYLDMSTNVTKIYGRDDLHLLIDLTYHSVLRFNLGRKELNGWLNTCIAGDSAQGKTEATFRMMQHYRLGERIDCKNATVAGLLGGVSKVGANEKWSVTWGAVPRHDRRVVLLEEVKGADPSVIGALTDMRSKGEARVSKIDSARAFARTRIIFISNPRNDQSVSAHSYGVKIITDLFQAPEDVRRLDAAMIVAENDVSLDTIHSVPPDVKHVFNSEVCRTLILWAWTRKQEDVYISEEVQLHILKRSREMCETFHEEIPLVTSATQMEKVARLAVALAVRTFSVNKHNQVLVRKCHVDFIIQFLVKEYSKETFGYLQWSKNESEINSILDPKIILTNIKNFPHPFDFVRCILREDSFSQSDLMDWIGQDQDQCRRAISLLVRKNAIRSVGRARLYTKTKGFIAILKDSKLFSELKDAQTYKEDGNGHPEM